PYLIDAVGIDEIAVPLLRLPLFSDRVRQAFNVVRFPVRGSMNFVSFFFRRLLMGSSVRGSGW
ncbi:MAG: hypothetical protein AAF532_17330, partial [Planctomycetota bacterium]